MSDSARIEHNRKVAAYYNETILVYKYWWSDPKTLSSHSGIWGPDVRTHRQAHQLHNRLLAERAGITGKDRVLDAGCGMGGSSLWLAETYGAHVDGITLSSEQVREAQQATQQRGLEHRVTFSVQDYTATEFKNDSFDVVWAVESVCHSLNKRSFLDEAFRVLRPGGRLVMGDYFRRSRSWSVDDEKYFHLAGDGTAIPDLDTSEEFFNSMREAGFQDISFEDRSDQTERSLRKLYYFSIVTFPIAWVCNRLGLMSNTVLEGSTSNYWQYELRRRNLIPYIILLAYKPEA